MSGSDSKYKDVQLLKAKLGDAFSDLVFTGAITDVDGFRDEEYDEEQVLFLGLQGKKWSEISTSTIVDIPDGIVLLRDDAFVAFLPAWLNCALTYESVREMMLYTFSPNDHGSNARFEGRIRMLTAKQLEILIACLTYYTDIEPSKYIKERGEHALKFLKRHL